MIEDFRYNLKPTPIAEDNTSCIQVSRGGGNHKRRRHIRVADAWIYQEVVISRSITINHIKSNENVADMFTKALEAPAFIKFRKMIGMESPTH